MHASSEPESASRQTPAAVPPPPPQQQQQQQNQQRQVILPRDVPQVRQERERTPLLGHQAQPQVGEAEDLYNFKGFMLFCFAAPGVSSKPCSK